MCEAARVRLYGASNAARRRAAAADVTGTGALGGATIYGTVTPH